MTDKEQALIAAAYRAAAEKCISTAEEGNPLHIVAIGYSKAIAELTPSDAEAKLRELMLKVAARVDGLWAEKQYPSGGAPTQKDIDAVVGRVLEGK